MPGGRAASLPEATGPERDHTGKFAKPDDLNLAKAICQENEGKGLYFFNSRPSPSQKDTIDPVLHDYSVHLR
jgi:hypothetical protein